MMNFVVVDDSFDVDPALDGWFPEDFYDSEFELPDPDHEFEVYRESLGGW